MTIRSYFGCEICNKRTRRRYGKTLCWSCYNKNKTKIGISGKLTLDQIKKTFDKSYIVRNYGGKKTTCGAIYLPKWLVGTKLKIVLAETE